MNAAYAPLTFSWRGSHSGGWVAGVVLAMPRKPVEVAWSPPQQIEMGAQGGFDLETTLAAFTERIEETTQPEGSAKERLERLCSEWTFGTVQIGEAREIQGEQETLLKAALSELSLNPV